ncbi:MAG: exodeoxyribonuclease V subunit beta [Pseudomonadota bacterium]
MNILDPIHVPLGQRALIEASAGTGKTYTITTLFVRLVSEGYGVGEILVVTFTEAAAAELKLRIRRRLAETLGFLESGGTGTGDDLTAWLGSGSGDDVRPRTLRIRAALLCFDEANIMTIHAFCLQILRENAFESRTPFDIRLTPDTSVLVRDIVLDFIAGRLSSLDPLMLKQLRIRSVNAGSLTALLSGWMSRPGVRLSPDSVPYTDIFSRYRELVSQIRSELTVSNQDLQDLLNSHPGVNRRSYQKNRVRDWLDQCFSDLSGPDPLPVMDEKGSHLYKFTRTRLTDKAPQGRAAPEHLFFDLCESLLTMSGILENNITALTLDFFEFFSKELERRKNELGICFFDDLVSSLANALQGPRANALTGVIRQRYKAALIDEFQDTDQQQYLIFSTLFSEPGTPFFMIGDPKQAIYAFRGGDIFAYLKAARDTGDRIYTLETNWRSDPLLVNGINTVFSLDPDPFAVRAIAFHRVKTPDTAQGRIFEAGKPVRPLQFLFVARDDPSAAGATDASGILTKDWASRNIPEIVARDLACLLVSTMVLTGKNGNHGPVTPKDVAVLVRTNNQAQAMEEALSRQGIPAFVSKTGSVFDAPEALALTDVLTAVLQPGNSGFVKGALCSDMFRLSGILVAGLDEDGLQAWTNRFREWKGLWEKHGFMRMIQDLLHSPEVLSPAGSDLSERGLTNVFHLAELLHKSAMDSHLGPEPLVQWFRQQQVPEWRGEAAGELRLDSDRSAVAIITVHKSKGLEYPVVYLPYLWEGGFRSSRGGTIIFHDPEDNDRVVMDIGSPDIERARRLALIEEAAENRRLLYVAMTRASSLCRILWGGFRSIEASALGTLLHPEKDFSDNAMTGKLEFLSRMPGSGIDFYMAEQVMPVPEAPLDPGLIHRLESRSVMRPVVQEWRVSSFSQIAVGDTAGGETVPELPVMADGSRRIRLWEFPRGAQAGDLLHGVFEHLDFSGPESNISRVVEGALSSQGYDVGRWSEPVTRSCREVIATSLTVPGLSLSVVPQGQRFNEMEFMFPVKTLSRDRIAKAFRDHMPAPLGSVYADRVQDLSFDPFQGYVKGFVDMVFRHGGLWYVVDYKSNFLGETYGHYSWQAMESAMMEHHYFLQYHLYVSALDRYLAYRIPDYGYDTHFGGVFYLFVRGMHPDYGPRFGVFFDKPCQELIRQF